MKKLFSLLLMIGLLIISGCSCTKIGEYEFEKLIIMVGDEEKMFTCSDLDERNPLVAPYCLIYDDMEIKLTKNGKMITEYDDQIANESWYKIKDGNFLVNDANDKEEGSFTKRGIYKRGKIILQLDDVKVIFEK